MASDCAVRNRFTKADLHRDGVLLQDKEHKSGTW